MSLAEKFILIFALETFCRAFSLYKYPLSKLTYFSNSLSLLYHLQVLDATESYTCGVCAFAMMTTYGSSLLYLGEAAIHENKGYTMTFVNLMEHIWIPAFTSFSAFHFHKDGSFLCMLQYGLMYLAFFLIDPVPYPFMKNLSKWLKCLLWSFGMCYMSCIFYGVRWIFEKQNAREINFPNMYR